MPPQTPKPSGNAATPTTPTAHASATVVLLRDAKGLGGVEVLLGERSADLDFHGGEWVFPGGRVDPEDHAQPPAQAPLQSGAVDVLHSEATARRAAVRECWEEVGVEVPHERLVAWSHWTTPLRWKKRFATWFFLAQHPGGAVRVDGSEMKAHRFLSPRDALSLRDEGRIKLPPPTFVTLAELLPYASVADALAAAQAREIPVILPRPQRVEHGAISLYPGDAGYDTGVLDHGGSKHRLEMLASGWRYVRDEL